MHSGSLWTTLLVAAAPVVSFVLGTTVGALVAWRRGSWLESVLPVSTFFQAMPYFFLATLLLLFFAQDLQWFPNHGGYEFENTTIGFNGPFLAEAMHNAI